MLLKDSCYDISSGKLSERPFNVLALGDDVNAFSGIGTISKQILTGFIEKKKWNVIQLAGGIKHVDFKPKRLENGILQIPVHGYGTIEIVLDVIKKYNIDIIWIITDPRSFLFDAQNPPQPFIWPNASKIKIPICYYQIWDEGPAPKYNIPFYKTCSSLPAMSRLTQELVLELGIEKKRVPYVPLCVNPNIYFPIESENLKDIKKNFLKKIKDDLKVKDLNNKFIIFWSNINMIRKHPMDLFRSLLEFQKKHGDLLLIAKTRFVAGTNLFRFHNDITKELNVKFINKFLSFSEMNFLYNIADLVVNVSSNEGWGLNITEALMAGTPTIQTGTGGLQDQYLEDINNEKRVSNLKITQIIKPKAEAFKGSPVTPYILDKFIDYEKFLNAVEYIYLNKNKFKSFEMRKKIHEAAFKKWNVDIMVDGNIKAIEYAIENPIKFERFTIKKVSELI